jgi:glycosyltransferase involved in cell wall biosynthesis
VTARRAAVLVPSNERMNPAGRRRRRVGGADMRFTSLYEALDAARGCRLVESRCERSTTCRTACTVSGAELPDTQPWYFDRSYCPTNAKQLASDLIAAGVSLVVCSSLNMYRYVADLARYDELTVVFDMHNVESELYRETRRVVVPGSRYDGVISEDTIARIHVAEQTAIEAADEVWTCSEEDVTLARRTYDLPDDKPFRVVRDVVATPAEPPAAERPTRAVFTARLDYFANILAAATLLEEIAPLLDPLPVVVAGAQPDESLRTLARPANAQLVADPESMSEVTRNGIMVVPLTFGGGSRFKIVEAFAAGLPVVSTRKGAEGLRATPGVHYLAVDTPAEFAAATRRLIEDDPLRHRLVRAAWELARDRYSLTALTAQMAKLDLAP